MNYPAYSIAALVFVSLFSTSPTFAAHRPCQTLEGTVVCEPVDLNCHSNGEGGGVSCPNYGGNGCQTLEGAVVCPDLQSGCKIFDGKQVCPEDGCHFNKRGKEVCPGKHNGT